MKRRWIFLTVVLLLSCVVTLASCDGDGAEGIGKPTDLMTDAETDAPVRGSGEDSATEGKEVPEESSEVYSPSDPPLPTEGLSYRRHHDGYGYVNEYVLVGTGSSNAEHLVIPSEYKGWPVREIDGDAFRGDTSIRSVTFLEGTKSISAGLFAGCTALESVTLPESLRSIGDGAFEGCTALESVTLPESLRSIGDGAFEGCTALESVTLPESLRSIGNGAFEGCTALEEVALGAEALTLGERVFLGCTSLRSVTVACLSDGSMPKETFGGCIALTHVRLPADVRQICEGAFKDCTSLEELMLPEGLRVIGASAFENCSSLTAANIPAGTKWIYQRAFGNCTALAEVTLPDHFESVSAQAFAECTALTHVEIPAGSLDGSAFRGCTGLEEVVFTGARKGIPATLLEGCTALSRVTLPEGVRVIGESAFRGCTSLGEIRLPVGVTEVRRSAFENCTSLTEIILPEGITTVEKRAFYGCSSLVRVTLSPFPEKIEAEAFDECASSMELFLTSPPTREQWLLANRRFPDLCFSSIDGSSLGAPSFFAYEYDGSNCDVVYRSNMTRLPGAMEGYLYTKEKGISPLSLTVNGTEFALDYEYTSAVFGGASNAYQRAMHYANATTGIQASVTAAGELIYFFATDYYGTSGDSIRTPVANEEDALVLATEFIEANVRRANPDVTLADYRRSIRYRDIAAQGENYVGYDYYHLTFTLELFGVSTEDVISISVSENGNVVYYRRGSDCSAGVGMELDLDDAYAYALEQAQLQAQYLSGGHVGDVQLLKITEFKGGIGLWFWVGLPHVNPVTGSSEGCPSHYFTQYVLVPVKQ